MSGLPKPDFARNMRLIGHSDQGGRPDGVQLMVHRGFAYVGHMFSKGFSVLDVRDALNPRAVTYVAAPPNTWNIHLQTHADLLLVIHAKDMFAAAEFADERAYYKGSLGQKVGTADARRTRDWSAGLAVYNIAIPANPRRIGFMQVEGGGIHRLWYTGGRWAYASALLDGFTDYIFITIDMSDPTAPREFGRWWIPGMNLAAGETPSWEASRRHGLHHAIVDGDTAYAAWRDAGMVVLDVSDRAKPIPIVHRNWSPPFGGGTHNCLPLADRDLLVVLDEAVLDHQEDGLKLIWVFDNRVPANPVSIATLPTPAEKPITKAREAISAHIIFTRTGPAASSRRSSFLPPIRMPASASSTSPTPSHPKRSVHWCRHNRRASPITRPNRARVIQSADVFVDAAGLIYATDYNAGLCIMELS